MLQQAFSLALDRAGLAPAQVELVFSGDLLNQCVTGSFGMRESGIPYLGLYGACSTMAEGLLLAALALEAGAAAAAAAVTASHFCTAERQYRLPLDYGGQRTPCAQWTVTGAGAVVLESRGAGPRIDCVTPGIIRDGGVKDANNMGAAMAPAAADTVLRHLRDLKTGPERYDRIVTGDLGELGSALFLDLLAREGVRLGDRHLDCGKLIFDRQRQDVHAGGSGCGCCAAVLAAVLLPELEAGRWRRILFCPTGALLSPTTTLQGESIPGICHGVVLSAD